MAKISQLEDELFEILKYITRYKEELVILDGLYSIGIMDTHEKESEEERITYKIEKLDSEFHRKYDLAEYLSNLN